MLNRKRTAILSATVATAITLVSPSAKPALAENDYTAIPDYLKHFVDDPNAGGDSQSAGNSDQDSEADSYAFSGGASGGVSLSSFDRRFLVTENVPGTLSAAVERSPDLTLHGATVHGSVCSRRDPFYQHGPQCFGLSASHERGDTAQNFDGLRFENGLGFPTVGTQAGVYLGGVGVPVELQSGRHEFEAAITEIEFFKNLPAILLGNNAVLTLGSGVQYTHSDYEERFWGSAAFVTAPANTLDFNYHTDAQIHTYSGQINATFATGTPLDNGLLAYGTLGGHLGVGWSSLDGTDSLERSGLGGNFSATNPLSDDAWNLTARAKASVGLINDRGFSVSLLGAVTLGDLVGYDLDRPDSTPGGTVLPSVADLTTDAVEFEGSLRATVRF